MIFRQLFEPKSSTCIPFFGCGQAALAAMAEILETIASLKLPYLRKMDGEAPEAMRRLYEPPVQGG